MKTKLLLLLPIGLFVAGCHTDMWVQPKTRAQHESTIFANKSVSRLPVAGTVSRGNSKLDDGYYKGFLDAPDSNGNQYVTEIPSEQAMKELGVKDLKGFLHRGQERFTIYCTPCHGQLGDGEGMISKRGLALRKKPASYHTDRMRRLPVGHFFDVITSGYGVMFSYASRVKPADRWAIIAYIRALQLSQNANPSDMTPSEVSEMKNGDAHK